MINKTKKAGFYFAALSVALSIAAVISYSILSKDGEKSPSIVYLITILGTVLQSCIIVLSGIKDKLKYNASSICASALFMTGFITMMMGRIEWLGGLAAHNASLTPMHPSFFVTIVLFVLTEVAAVTSSFMPLYSRD